MWKLIRIFLSLGVMYKDQNTVENRLHQKLVTKEKILSEDEFNEIHSLGKISLISYKLTYAFSVGKKIYGSLFGLLLVFTTFFPSLVLFGLLMYLMMERLDDSYILYVIAGIGPVMAAYFVTKGFELLKHGYTNFPLITFIFLCVFGFVLVFVLQWPIVLVLFGSLFFFLCFMKGGNING